jgi:putative sugar O-methyltransferase
MKEPNQLNYASSVTDNEEYPQTCLEASHNYRAFGIFRQNPAYTSALEHVTEAQGQACMDIIATDPQISTALEEFRHNDSYGSPFVCEYPSVGRFSPTTLRYVKVLVDLKSYFGSLDNHRICEIGVGYGGQCRVINAYFKPASYCLIDILPALGLAQRYLDNYVLPSVMSYMTMNQLPVTESDLVISNYAFSELRRPIQEAYLKKVILPAKRGYVIFNQIAPADFQSYTVAELLQLIPGARVFEERPLTHPHNCLIVWGEQHSGA